MTTAAAQVRWIVAGFVVLAVGFVAGRASVQPQTPQTVASAEGTAPCWGDHNRPSTSGTDLPDQTPEAAVAAATSYAVALDGPDLLDPTRRRQLIERIAAAQVRDDLESDLGDIVALLRHRLGLSPDVIRDDSLVWRPVPAGWRIVRYDGTDATVAVWGTGIAMLDGRLLAPIAWRTTLVDVTWQQEQWRLVGFRSEAGPEPPHAGGGSSAPDVATEIQRFSAFVFRPHGEGGA